MVKPSTAIRALRPSTMPIELSKMTLKYKKDAVHRISTGISLVDLQEMPEPSLGRKLPHLFWRDPNSLQSMEIISDMVLLLHLENTPYDCTVKNYSARATRGTGFPIPSPSSRKKGTHTNSYFQHNVNRITPHLQRKDTKRKRHHVCPDLCDDSHDVTTGRLNQPHTHANIFLSQRKQVCSQSPTPSQI